MLAKHCVLFALLIACVYTDLARGKIYNWCTVPGIVVGLALNFVLGGVWRGGWMGANLGSAAIAVGVVALIFAWPYLKGGIAAGDVKLMLAVAAIGGFHNHFILNALAYTALIGLLMAVLTLIWRGRLWAGVKGAARFTFSGRSAVAEDGAGEATGGLTTIPYGAAIAVGSMLAWFVVELPASPV